MTSKEADEVRSQIATLHPELAKRRRRMASERSAILAVGAIMVDIVCQVPRLLLSGEGIVADDVHATVGGCAYNSANVLRQAGAPYRLFAPVGQGIFAGFVERELTARGMQALRVDADSCGTVRDNGGCVCFVEPDGERTMLTMPGIDRHFEASWFSALDVSQFGSGLASGYEIEGAGGNAIIDFFVEHSQIQMYYAPGPRIMGVGSQKTARINALHPIWHLNDQEARAYTGCDALEQAGFAIAQQCRNAVIITAGAAGAHFFEGSTHLLVPTDPVQVVDSIGAGDAHLGALMAARAQGQSWECALAFANKVAGAVCGVAGPTLPDELFCAL